MPIFSLSLGDMLLAFVPFVVTMFGAIMWLRALKSDKHGADINDASSRKWLRLVSAMVYLGVIQIVLFFVPSFGWGGVVLIVPFLLLFVIINVWLLFPERLTRPTDDADADEDDKSRRQKFDEFCFREIPVKRWFVSGPKLWLIQAARRILFPVVLILLLLFGVFAEDGAQGSDTAGGTTQIVASDGAQKREASPDSKVDPSPSSSNPAASPTPTAEATPTERRKDCNTPELTENSQSSKVTARYLQVCDDGSWRDWVDVKGAAGADIVSLTFVDAGQDKAYYYGNATYGDGLKVLVRFSKSDI